MRNFVTYGCIAIALSTWANIGAAATQCSTTSTFSSHSGAGNAFLGDNGNCSKDAGSFKLKVYEFAICTGHATVADKSMCTTLFQDTAGSDLILSKGASLPLGADVTLAEGTYTYAYIHVDNVINSIVKSINNNNAINQIFNISNSILIYDFVKTVRSTLGKRMLRLVIPKFIMHTLVRVSNIFYNAPLNITRINHLSNKALYNSSKSLTPESAIICLNFLKLVFFCFNSSITCLI